MKRPQIDQRLNALKEGLEKIDLAYQATLFDVDTEAGLEFGRLHPYNDEYIAKEKLKNQIISKRRQALYSEVFIFSQFFYSLKEYLKFFFPNKKSLIEDFFSNEKTHGFSRKDLCNFLKHEPSRDMRFKRIKIGESTVVEGNCKRTTMYLKNTWEFQGWDSIELCHAFYNDLLIFLGNENMVQS